MQSLEQRILDPLEPEPVVCGRFDDRFAGEDLARSRDIRDPRRQVVAVSPTRLMVQ
jgi:hypothetical protein